MGAPRIIMLCMVARLLFVVCCIVLVFSRIGRSELKDPIRPDPKSYYKEYPPIIEQSFKGDLNSVKKLLVNDADPNARAFDNSTALQFVCRNGDDTFEIQVAQELFKAGARARVTDNSNATPLHQVSAVALFKNRNDLIHMLFLHGADMNARTVLQEGGTVPGTRPKDYTLLDMLVNNFDRYGVIDYLQNWGGMVTKEELKKSLDLSFVLGFRDITDAITGYALEIGLSDILIKGYVAQTTGGWPLFLAAIRDAEGLLYVHNPAKKGWVENLESRGLNRLMIAALMGDIELARKEIGNKDTISNDLYKQTPLFMAIMRRHTQIAQLLLDAGANVKFRDYCGNTPLHMVAWLGDIGLQQELTQLLIKYGAQFKARNDDRKDNVLQRAIRLRDFPYVQYLINSFPAADLGVADKNVEGLTAYYLAEKLGLRDMLRILPKV